MSEISVRLSTDHSQTRKEAGQSKRLKRRDVRRDFISSCETQLKGPGNQVLYRFCGGFVFLRNELALAPSINTPVFIEQLSEVAAATPFKLNVTVPKASSFRIVFLIMQNYNRNFAAAELKTSSWPSNVYIFDGTRLHDSHSQTVTSVLIAPAREISLTRGSCDCTSCSSSKIQRAGEGND